MMIRKKNRIEAKGSMLLLCATEAEVAFFTQFKKDCRYTNLSVVKGSGNTLEKLLSEAGTLRTKGKYTAAWVLFGLEDVDATLEDVSLMQETAEKKKVQMLWFAPSFDLYFALFETCPRRVSTKEQLEARVKAVYPGYELSARYFLTEGISMNFKLYPKLAVADQNARSYNDISEMDDGYKATSLPDFLEALKSVCGKADMSQARNRF